jgi:hypothetical protein
MNRRTCFAALLFAYIVTIGAHAAPRRPKILGISHIAVYTSNHAAADHYYREVVGAVKLPDPENPQGVKYALSDTQYIEVLPLPANAGINRCSFRNYLGSGSLLMK